MKKITTLILALGFAVALASTASAQVKLAVGGPITGPSAATGAQMKNGVDQAAAHACFNQSCAIPCMLAVDGGM